MDYKMQIFRWPLKLLLLFLIGFLATQFVLIEITISFGRSTEFKKDLLTRIINNLKNKPGISPHDVMVIFVETARENWAFAGGVQYYVEDEGSN